MKHFKFLFTLVIVSSMTIFQSCSDSDDSSNAPAAGAFQVDFDGQTYVADVVSATITDNNINVTGLRGTNGENVTLTIFGASVGTYQFGVVNNGTEVNGAAYIEANNDGSGVFVAQTDGITSQGELVIIAIDEVNLKMSGNFSFTAYNPNTEEIKEFTNGSFTDITYSDGLVSVGENSFFAKVDGSEFVEDLIAGTSLSIGGMSTIAISATKNSNETIGLYFDADVTPGTYDFGGFGGTPLAQYNLSSSDINIGAGTFIISSHDIENKRIIGTFEFTASPFGGGSNSYEITEGSFDVIYF